MQDLYSRLLVRSVSRARLAPTSANPASRICTNLNSKSSSTSRLAQNQPRRTSRGCHLGDVTWPQPGKSSNHTSSTSIGGSPTMAALANMLDEASRTCAVPSAPFGCSVFDIGCVGSYDASSNVSAIADILQFCLCATRTRNSRGVRSP